MHLFTAILYQPFFNLLIYFYYLVSLIPGLKPDMGLAVILFTLVIRFLLLPITIASTRTKKERHDIELEISKIKQHTVSKDAQKQKIRKIFRSNRRILISEGVSFTVQFLIFIVLYRIFTTGLKGADLHLIYSSMPPIHLPFNLTFLDTYDLTHPSLALNFLQSFTIFGVEAVSLLNSPFPVSRSDAVRYLFILPLASFFIFAFLPSGKKLFVITTLWFSFFFILFDMIFRAFSDLTKTALSGRSNSFQTTK